MKYIAYLGGNPYKANINIWIEAKARPIPLGPKIMTSCATSVPYKTQHNAFNHVEKEFINGNAAVDFSFKTVPSVANGEPLSITANEQPMRPILDAFLFKNSL